MKQVFRYDLDGFYIEPVIVGKDDDVPKDCTELHPNDFGSFIKGKLNADKTAWIEGATQEEIDIIKNMSQQPSEIEQLKKNQTDLIYTLMLKGVI